MKNEITRNSPYFNTKANSGNGLRVQVLLIHYCAELRANRLPVTQKNYISIGHNIVRLSKQFNI